MHSFVQVSGESWLIGNLDWKVKGVERLHKGVFCIFPFFGCLSLKRGAIDLTSSSQLQVVTSFTKHDRSPRSDKRDRRRSTLAIRGFPNEVPKSLRDLTCHLLTKQPYANESLG